MIVRIQLSGQYRLADGVVAKLQELDSRLVDAVNGADEAGAQSLLGQILAVVQQEGQPIGVDELVSSDLILPAPDATIDEVRSVLREDGLIPG